MNDKIHKALLEDGPCLSPEELRDYHDSKLDAAAQHRVEAHVLHCDLCSEALDGLAMAGLSAEEFDADVADINDRAWKRVEALSRKPNRRPIIWMSAASLLLIGISASWFWYNSVSQNKQMDAVFAEQFSLPPADSALLASAHVLSDSPAAFNSNLASGEVFDALEKRNLAAPTESFKNIEGQASGLSGAGVKQPVAEVMEEDLVSDETKSLTEEAELASPSRASAPPYPVSGGTVTTTESKKEKVSVDLDREEPTYLNDNRQLDEIAGDKDYPRKQGNQKGKNDERDKQSSGGYKPASPGISNATPATSDDANYDFGGVADSVSATVSVAKPSSLLNGVGAYNAQDYKSAVDQFNEVLKVDPNHQEANFYAGVSYLGMNDAQKAIPCLERASTGSNATLREDAEWYLSLAYLKSRNKSKAEPLLKSIESRSDSRYRARAADALEGLRKP